MRAGYPIVPRNMVDRVTPRPSGLQPSSVRRRTGMRPNRIKQLWREGKPVRATWSLIGDPLIAEMLGNAGVDAVLLDMQHGIAITPERAGACLQAISSTPAVPLVRIPWNDPVHFQYVLDAGAYGVIVPLVNSPADARR